MGLIPNFCQDGIEKMLLMLNNSYWSSFFLRASKTLFSGALQTLKGG
jgi:hypothetical protein